MPSFFCSPITMLLLLAYRPWLVLGLVLPLFCFTSGYLIAFYLLMVEVLQFDFLANTLRLWFRPTTRACWHASLWDQFGHYYYWGGDEIDDFIRHSLRPETSDGDCLIATRFRRGLIHVFWEEAVFRLGAKALAFIIGDTCSWILWSGAGFALMHNWFAGKRWSRSEHIRIFVKCFLSGIMYYIFMSHPRNPIWLNFVSCCMAHFLYNHLNLCWSAAQASAIINYLCLQSHSTSVADADLSHIRKLRTLSSLHRLRPLLFIRELNKSGVSYIKLCRDRGRAKKNPVILLSRQTSDNSMTTLRMRKQPILLDLVSADADESLYDGDNDPNNISCAVSDSDDSEEDVHVAARAHVRVRRQQQQRQQQQPPLRPRMLMIDERVHLREAVAQARRAFEATFAAFKRQFDAHTVVDTDESNWAMDIDNDESLPLPDEALQSFLKHHKETLKLLLGSASAYVHDVDDNHFWMTRIKKARTEEEMLDLYTLITKTFPV